MPARPPDAAPGWAPYRRRYAPGVYLQKLILRQVLYGILVGALIAITRGITSGVIYGILFVVISTPVAYWVEQRRARMNDEQPEGPD